MTSVLAGPGSVTPNSPGATASLSSTVEWVESVSYAWICSPPGLRRAGSFLMFLLVLGAGRTQGPRLRLKLSLNPACPYLSLCCSQVRPPAAPHTPAPGLCSRPRPSPPMPRFLLSDTNFIPLLMSSSSLIRPPQPPINLFSSFGHVLISSSEFLSVQHRSPCSLGWNVVTPRWSDEFLGRLF